MSDPVRHGGLPAADALSGVERDARVEQLLLQGLDAYFSGDYETAVHVWTRVLFLDRGHARARAYIERARSAQAERQRESEELLHRGVAAFDRGETGDARALLNAAVSQGASPDVALSYLGRLDRLEAPRPPAAAVEESRPAVRADAADPVAVREGWLRTLALSIVLVAGGVAALGTAAVLLELSDVRDVLKLRPELAAVHGSVGEDPLPVPRAAELALTRARAQFASGHVNEALASMTLISPSDPLRPDADRLRADIQRALLAASPVTVSPSPEAARVP